MAKKNEVQELNVGGKTFKDRAFNSKWFYDDNDKIIKIASSFKDFLTGKNSEEFLVQDFYTDPEIPTFKLVETKDNGLILVKSSNELK
jgi:hypothetical protein